MKKRFFAIFLATILFAGLSITCPAESADFVQTEPLPPFDGAENLVPNPGFEELNEEGLPIGWANKEKAKIDDEFAHSGRYSMKVTTTGDGAVAYAASQLIPVDCSKKIKYQISGWVRTSSGLHAKGFSKRQIWFRWEYYTDSVANSETYIDSGGTACMAPIQKDRWELVSTTFMPKPPVEHAKYMQLYLWVQPPAGEIWFDDLELVPVTAPNVMELECDQYFYYEDAEIGYAKAAMFPQFVDEHKDNTVDFIFYDKDGTTVLKEQKNTPLVDGKAAFSYSLSLIGEKKTAYPIRAILRDAAGNELCSLERRVYRYNRPTMMNEDGELLNEDGSIYVFANVFGLSGLNSEPEKMEEVGMNNGISSMGHAGAYLATNGKNRDLKNVLDSIDANGMKVMVCIMDSYRTIGNPMWKDVAGKMIAEFKDHPAILGWYIMDEPFDMVLGDVEAELETAYKIVRDNDEKHPVWLVDNNKDSFFRMTKYADMIYPDAYPAWPKAKEPLFPAPYDTSSANPAVHDSDMAQMVRREAERYGKNFGICHQAFDYNGYNPVPAEFRSMIYQTIFERGHGDSWYHYVNFSAKADQMEFFKTYTEEEQGLIRELFGRASTLPKFNRYDCNDYSYQGTVKDGKLYMMIINRHATEQTIDVSLRSQNGLVVASGEPEELYLVGESVKPTVSGETLTVTIPAVNVSLIRLDAPDATAEKLSAPAFDDLEGYDWAAEAIEELYAKDILSADALRAYAPGKAITRGDFAKYLIRALDLEVLSERIVEDFADVPKDAPYYREVMVGKTLGILRGVGDNAFNPETPITRQDLMVICRRGMVEGFKAGGDAADLSTFSDSALVADYAEMAVSTMNAAGIVKGNADGTLNPLGNTTRAEAAVIMERIMNIK